MASLVGRFILIAIITCLPACAIITNYKDYLKANEGKSETKFSYHHISSDFKVDWNTLQKGSDTVIDGLITNIREMRVNDINPHVVVLGTDGNKLSEGEALSDHFTSYRNDSFAFNVILKDAFIAKGYIILFYIDYRLQDGRWGGKFMESSFKVDATTGTDIEETKKLDFNPF